MKPYGDKLASKFQKMKYAVIKEMVELAIKEYDGPVTSYRRNKIRRAIIYFHFE